MTRLLVLLLALAGAAHAARPTVIVVGAGVSGLACATALLRHADVDVLVLEARDRVGGRVWTDRSVGVPLDLGASWIHGIANNPIHALAQAAHIRTAVTDWDAADTHRADGAKLTPAERAAMTATHARLKTSVLAQQEDLDEGDDAPLRHALDAGLRDLALTPEQRREQEHIIAGDIEGEYSGAATDLSLAEYDTDEEKEGDDVTFPDGYDRIPALLAHELEASPRARVLLAHPVTRVAHTPASVTITTRDGASFTGAAAVVTLPLGVLKRGSVAFAPRLPARKRAAIDRLGFGLFDKLYLKFARRFWSDASFIEYIGPDPALWSRFMNLEKSSGAPVLVTFNAAARAEDLEAQPDAAVVAGAMRALRAIYGPTVPEPVATLRTRWRADPYAYGSYSYAAVGSTSADRAALAAPAGRLFFAGEATATDYYATVHGAYLSGVRAAAQVRQQLTP